MTQTPVAMKAQLLKMFMGVICVCVGV